MNQNTIVMRILLTLLLAGTPIGAAAGPLVLYQGTLHNSEGKPATGTFLLNFEIRSGDKTWVKSTFVRSRNGAYRVTLGSEKVIADSLVQGDFTIKAIAPAGAAWVSQVASKPMVVQGGKAKSANTKSSSKMPITTSQKPRIDYEGTLADAQGNPKSGTYLLKFQIFPGITGGKLAWESARYVRINNGKFNAELGGKKPLPTETLRGTYRIKAAPPAGLNWIAKASGIPVVHGIAPAPLTTSGEAAGSALERVRNEIKKVREEAKKAKREAQSSRKRVQALEDRMLRSDKGSASTQRKSRVYVVKSGDTLRSISRKVYGSEGRWTEIYQANHDRVLRGGEVVAGQKLLIPSAGGTR